MVEQRQVGVLDTGEQKFFFIKELYIAFDLSRVEYSTANFLKFSNLVVADMQKSKSYALIVNYRKQIIGTVTIRKSGLTVSELNTFEKFLKDVNIPIIKQPNL